MKPFRSFVTHLAAVLAVVALAPAPVFAAGTTATMQRANQRAASREAPQDPAAMVATVAPAAAAAQLNCQVDGGRLVGELDGGGKLFEASCAQGPGFLVTDTTPPQSFNCLQLMAEAERLKAADPEAEVGPQCALTKNIDAAASLAPAAQAAGISCQVDQGKFLGQTQDGATRYEIGCAGVDGYWLDVSAAGASTIVPCLAAVDGGGECPLTTPQEQIATVQAKLQGAASPACQIQSVRSAGRSASGDYYEVECANAPGFIFRTAPNGGAFAEAVPCAQAENIAGGCKLGAAGVVAQNQDQHRASLLAAANVTCAVTGEQRVGQERGDNPREVVEFGCSDRPLGLVAILPMSGDDPDDVTSFDCLSAGAIGVTCTMSSADAIKGALKTMLQATQIACDPTTYRTISRAAGDVGDTVEVKCADGKSYIGDFPDNRTGNGIIVPCTEAATVGETCKL